ncbi:hypothetical protein [Methylomarinum vadi]|nr:hypothetical protein [Methylomarinum vadi]
MNILHKDILVGVLFVSGIFGFMSGEFILSTVMFATATVFSNFSSSA